MKCIYIDKEGSIKFGEFPEEHKRDCDSNACDHPYKPDGNCKCERYDNDLQKAKDNAIPIQNVECAHSLIWNDHKPAFGTCVDTIYPYNGEYEIKEDVKHVYGYRWEKYKVVILKEPVKQDSEAEELFRQVIEIFNREHKRLGRPDYTELKAKFTITSK